MGFLTLGLRTSGQRSARPVTRHLPSPSRLRTGPVAVNPGVRGGGQNQAFARPPRMFLCRARAMAQWVPWRCANQSRNPPQRGSPRRSQRIAIACGRSACRTPLPLVRIARGRGRARWTTRPTVAIAHVEPHLSSEQSRCATIHNPSGIA